MTASLVLVGCGAAKRDEPAPAKDLYTSTYFGLKHRYAEADGDRWAILSAEHGLLPPERRTESYDTVMDDVDAQQWARDVWRLLREYVPVMPPVGSEDVVVTVLAGSDYVDPLRPFIQREPWRGRYPFDQTSGIGEQMGWLSAELDRLESEAD